MADKPSSIRNVGPAGDEFFGRAGIESADQLRELGADEAYFRALQAGGKAHFIGYYVLVMGLQGRPWNDCKGAEKTALKARFEAIKKRARHSGRSETALDAALRDIGVVPVDPE